MRKSIIINNILCIEKMEEFGFMEELEKNYSIFLDVDNFVNNN